MFIRATDRLVPEPTWANPVQTHNSTGTQKKRCVDDGEPWAIQASCHSCTPRIPRFPHPATRHQGHSPVHAMHARCEKSSGTPPTVASRGQAAQTQARQLFASCRGGSSIGPPVPRHIAQPPTGPHGSGFLDFARSRPGAEGRGLGAAVWRAIDRKESIGCWCPTPGASQITRQAAGPKGQPQKSPRTLHQPHADGRPSRQSS